MDGIQSMKGRLSRNSSARDLSHVNPDAPDLEQPSTGPPSTPVASCSTDRVPAEQVGTWESYSYPKAVPPPIFKPLDLVDPLNDIFCGYKRSGKKKLPKFLDSHSQIIQEVEFRGTLVQVEEIPTENVIGRRLRVTLNDRAVRSERKAFHYSIGDISMTSGLRGSNKKGVKGALSGAGGVAKDWAKAKLAQDSFIKPEYFGNGVVYFETTWAYLYILSCGLHDNLIIENGCWYASDSTISVDLHVESNIVTGLLGGGFTETRLKGEGWVVIKLPVPFSELHRVQLEDTEVRISEGQIVLLRRGAFESIPFCQPFPFLVTNSTPGNITHRYVTNWSSVCPRPGFECKLTLPFFEPSAQGQKGNKIGRCYEGDR